MHAPNQAQLNRLLAQMSTISPRAAHGVMAFGDPRVDGCLAEGGLALGNLHELLTEGLEAETGAATAAFTACLLARLPGDKPIFWITQADDLYPPGLLLYGLDPARVIEVRTRDDTETLASMETVLHDGAAAACVAEIGSLERTPSRRLQLACLKHGTTGFALRRWPYGRRKQDRDSTASVTRWRIDPTPCWEGEDDQARQWTVTLTHARGGRPGQWIMQAGRAEDAHRFSVVAQLADIAAASPGARRAG